MCAVKFTKSEVFIKNSCIKIVYGYKSDWFKVGRLQIIVVAKKYIYVSQLFISRMPKVRAIPQVVSAPLNLYQLQNILGGATHHVSTVMDNV